MRKLLIVSSLLLGAASLSGCATFAGMTSGKPWTGATKQAGKVGKQKAKKVQSPAAQAVVAKPAPAPAVTPKKKKKHWWS